MFKRALFLLVVISIFVVGGLTFISAQSAEDAVCMNAGGFIEDGQCMLRSAVEIEVAYPTEIAAYPFVQQTVDAYLDTARAEFVNNFVQYGMDFPSPGPWSFHVISDAFYHNDIMSLQFTISDYTGGAHPNAYFRTFMFDLAQGRELGLADMFIEGEATLNDLAPLVQADLIAQWGDDMDTQWMQDGTTPTVENYQNVLLAPDALVFLFPPYQVGPYAMGPQQVSLPLTQISGFLVPALQ